MATIDYETPYRADDGLGKYQPHTVTHVSEASLRAKEIVAAVVATVMTLGPLAAAFLQSGTY